MKKKILTGIAILSIALITTINVNAYDHLEEAGDQGGGCGGGSKKCYWEQIAHAPDYSWIKVKCMETIYSDPSKVKCTCGSADEIW